MFLWLTKGFPASGKSTWAFQEAAAYPDYVLVSRDDIRATIRPTWNWDEATNRANETLVTRIQGDIVEAAFEVGRPVICHNTNLYRGQYADLLRIAERFDAEVRYRSFLHVPITTCIVRDAPRPEGKRVGEEALLRMHAEYEATASHLK